jgi:hypothetical protein
MVCKIWAAGLADAAHRGGRPPDRRRRCSRLVSGTPASWRGRQMGTRSAYLTTRFLPPPTWRPFSAVMACCRLHNSSQMSGSCRLRGTYTTADAVWHLQDDVSRHNSTSSSRHTVADLALHKAPAGCDADLLRQVARRIGDKGAAAGAPRLVVAQHIQLQHLPQRRKQRPQVLLRGLRGTQQGMLSRMLPEPSIAR